MSRFPLSDPPEAHVHRDFGPEIVRTEAQSLEAEAARDRAAGRRELATVEDDG